MNTFLRNIISNLYHVASAPKTAAQDAFAERLQGVRETTSLLYNRIMENMECGQQERLKEAEEEKTRHENEENSYIRIEIPFNILMTEFSEDSDINDLIKRMLARIKIQVENSRMPEGGSSLNKILGMTIKLSKSFPKNL